MKQPKIDKKKILVVDDNPAFRDLIGMVFGGEFSVLAACDGREGLKMARQEHPGLILLDVMMPRVSGLEMLRDLRSEEETRQIPVIVLTASHMDESVKARLEQDVNVASFLKKPCGVDALRVRIREVLDKR